MQTTHDASAEHPAPPVWFTFFAWLVPVGIFIQFLTAGLGLFLNGALLGLHGGMGAALSLPIIGLLAAALIVPRLKGFAWSAAAVLILYLAQVGLAASAAPVPLSLHPANAALLLSASLVLLAKVERRRAQRESAT